MTNYLRSKINGIVFDYNERLAIHPDVEVISERQAFPERFAPVDIAKHVPKVDLTIKEETEAPPVTPPELAAQKGRVFGNIGQPKVAKKTTEPKLDVTGLKGEF